MPDNILHVAGLNFHILIPARDPGFTYPTPCIGNPPGDRKAAVKRPRMSFVLRMPHRPTTSTGSKFWGDPAEVLKTVPSKTKGSSPRTSSDKSLRSSHC